MNVPNLPAGSASPRAARAPAAALLLAAGLSTRMGRSKPLLPFGGQTLVTYQVEQLTRAGIAPVVVVVGFEADAVVAALQGTTALCVHNPDYREGRASSIRSGARALADELNAIAILNVDQPRPSELIERALAAHAALGGQITRPVHAGRGGHPTIFTGELLAELREVSDATEGLRAVLQRHRAGLRDYEEPDARIVLDLNDEASYQHALSIFRLGQSR